VQQPPAIPLEDQVQRLTDRLAAVESRLASLEGRPAVALSPVPAVAGADAPFAIVAIDSFDGLKLTTALGRSLIILGGAFLLRAVTDAGTWPPLAGVSIGLLYALAWLVTADRAAARGDRVRAIFDGATALVIGFPLIVEATLRFRLLTPEVSALVLTLFAAMALAAASRMQVQGLAWLMAVGGMLTALTLILRVGVWAPYALFLIALGVATLWLGYIREWRGLRWPAGFLAVIASLGVTSRALAAPPVDPPLTAWTVQGVLVVSYLASIAIRTLVRGRQVIVFEVVQTLLVLIVGVGGALAVSQSVEAGGLMLGSTLIGLGVATYLVSFQFLPRESRGALNFYFYSSLALVFVVLGLRTALSGTPQAVALTAFAALLAVAWSRSDRVSLGGHAAVALVAASISGGLLRLDEAAFAGDLPAVQLLWPAVATLAVALLIEGSSAAGTRTARVSWADVPSLVIAGLALAGLAALATMVVGRAFGLDGDAGRLGTLRTAVLSALAVGCGLLNRPGRFSAVGKLAYPLLALTGLKLAVVDLQYSTPAMLFVALACFGTALVLTPKLRSA
jgi:hypothetical protein